jgi:hypothetical protein
MTTSRNGDYSSSIAYAGETNAIPLLRTVTQVYPERRERGEMGEYMQLYFAKDLLGRGWRGRCNSSEGGIDRAGGHKEMSSNLADQQRPSI